MTTDPDSAPEPRPAVRLIETSFAGRADLGTGVSDALLQQVARGEIGATSRLHRTGPIVAFGRLDKLRPGYRRAVAIARERGYEPIERLAGGRAAVFHEGSLSFSLAIRTQRAYTGTRDRFTTMADSIAAALSGFGIDARVGEVEGEYCPGAYSVSSAGRVKLAGIGQRVISGGAHVGAVVVVRGGERIRTILEPIYEALELDWDPATSGSLAAEIGESDETLDAASPDPLIERVTTGLRDVLAERFDLVETDLDERTLQLAAELRSDHAAPG